MQRSSKALCLRIDNFWIYICDDHCWQLNVVLQRPFYVLLEKPNVALFALDVCKAQSKNHNFAVVVHSCKVDLKQTILVLTFSTAAN